MRVLFLTECGPSIGFGHLTRCSGLAAAFEDLGLSCSWIIFSDDETLKSPISSPAQVFAWFAPKNRTRLETEISNSDIVVIDSYHANKSVYSFVTNKARLLVAIDDNLRVTYPAGIVVNGTTFAEEFSYPIVPHQLRLLGSTYTPMRKEFSDSRTSALRNDLECILISLGGSDPRNLTPRIMTTLAEAFPKTKKRVIVGPSFSNEKEIQQRAASTFEILRHLEAAAVREAILDADLVVSSSGQTLYELASLGAPAVTIQVAENQARNIEGFKRLGSIRTIGRWDSKTLEADLVAAIHNLVPVNQRKLLSDAGLSSIDGKGAQRIAMTALEECKLKDTPFRPAIWDDRDALLSWRNDSTTVANSLSQKPVSQIEHYKWFSQVLAKPKRRIWIYEPMGRPVGMVRFDQDQNSSEMSWNIAPEARNQGHGTRMVKEGARLFIQQSGKPVFARVLTRNPASIQVALRAGFQSSHQDGETAHFMMS